LISRQSRCADVREPPNYEMPAVMGVGHQRIGSRDFFGCLPCSRAHEKVATFQNSFK
jgi:hypothetical protein